jgi:hypothetical protein
MISWCGGECRREGTARVSPAAKLCGFLVLLAVIFAGAYAAGARLGPVSTTQSGGGGSGTMNMSGHSQVAPAGSGRP